MLKDLEYYKKQENSFIRRIELLKKEIDKLTVDKRGLREQLRLHGVGSQRELLCVVCGENDSKEPFDCCCSENCYNSL